MQNSIADSFVNRFVIISTLMTAKKDVLFGNIR